MWTRFMDMHSGGGQKEKWAYIYIEAPQEEAELIFYNRFGHNPNRVTCTCCGQDYSIDDKESLEQLTGYDRGCAYVDNKYIERKDPKYSWREYITLNEYKRSKDILFIHKNDILDSERKGSLPIQGYVWMD